MSSANFDQEPGRALLLVTAAVPAEYATDFNRWYDEEHIPDLLGCPGFLTATRYASVEAPHRYMALYNLTSTAALQSEPYLALRALAPSALAERVRPHRTDRRREIYRELPRVWEG